MRNVKKLEEILQHSLKSYSLDQALRLDYLLEKYKILPLLESEHKKLLGHVVGVSKLAGVLFDTYSSDLGFSDFEYIKTTTILSAFFHDLGKFIPTESNFDSLEIEMILRKLGFSDIAQGVRHNPYLFVYDLYNGLLTVPQLIVAYADSFILGNGEKVSRDERLRSVLKKKINRTFQKAYWEILERLYKNKVIRSPYSVHSIAFFERCDGRYPVTNSLKSVGKLSSFHLGKELIKMGYKVTIFTDNSNEFVIEGVKFYGIGNDLLESFGVAKHHHITFVTGWTSLFKQLKNTNWNLPMIVMRSLKESSLTKKRIELLSNNPSRTILVSKESALLLKKYGAKNTNSFRIINNGVDKKTFYYAQEEIKDYFIYAGAVVEEKGIEDVFKLAICLKHLKCYIAGSSKMYGREESLTEKVPDNVHFLGEISQSELANLYRSALFSVCFTKKDKIFETFGKSAAESQLCGCPVLYVKNGGLHSTVIKHELNFGLNTFKVSNYISFVNAYREKLHNSYLREELALLSKEYFKSWKTIASKYMIAANIELSYALRKLLKSKKKIFEYLYT